MAAEVPQSQPASYPIRLNVDRPEKQSRLLNLPLFIGTIIRAILLIPHLLILYVLNLVAGVIYFIATFAILFTGRYPEGMYKLVAGYQRWSHNTSGYLFSLYDEYPPFSMDPQQYRLNFELDYPPTSSRLLNFPIFGLIIRSILVIPSAIVVGVLALVALIILFVAKFAILFTGSFPEGMHNFVTGVLRWSARLNGYLYGLTDRYPPFSLS